MNIQSKNTLVILGTLLLGVIIGFLISGMITRLRIDNMRQDFARQGMDYRFMRALNPSTQQMEDIRPIFDKYNDIRREQFEEHFEKQKEIFNDFESELHPFLTPQQLEKMEMMKNNFGNNFSGFKQHKKNGNGKKYRGGRSGRGPRN